MSFANSTRLLPAGEKDLQSFSVGETASRFPTGASATGELLEVEQVVGKRTADGEIEYEVRWKGYGIEDDT